MDNVFKKPYLAETYGSAPAERYYVYPREDLVKESIFPYLVLDGGAYLFISDHFGDVGSDGLLNKVMSGEVFDLLRGKDGKIDWLFCKRVSANLGLPSNFEWQSWPQRLYMLLPLAQKYLQTGETFVMPAGFEECALVLDYGTETAVLVTFTRTGDSTVTAEGSYIRADSISDETVAPFLAMLWEKE